MRRFYHNRSVARRQALKVQRWVREDFYGVHPTKEQRDYFDWFLRLIGKTCLDCRKCTLDRNAGVVCPRGPYISYSPCDEFEEK